MRYVGPDRYWFHAKRRGLGWGPPARWQGWVVFVLALAPLLVLAVDPSVVVGVVAAAALVLFVAVVIRTGDPAGRHWR